MKSPLQSNSTRTPTTIPDDPPPHVCGRCRNPWTGGREDCPNNRRQP